MSISKEFYESLKGTTNIQQNRSKFLFCEILEDKKQSLKITGDIKYNLHHNVFLPSTLSLSIYNVCVCAHTYIYQSIKLYSINIFNYKISIKIKFKTFGALNIII